MDAVSWVTMTTTSTKLNALKLSLMIYALSRVAKRKQNFRKKK